MLTGSMDLPNTPDVVGLSCLAYKTWRVHLVETITPCKIKVKMGHIFFKIYEFNKNSMAWVLPRSASQFG